MNFGPFTPAERDEKLWQLFDALLVRLLDTIKGDEPVKASYLDVARLFLHSQGISVRSRPDALSGLQAAAEARGLPFDPGNDTSH